MSDCEPGHRPMARASGLEFGPLVTVRQILGADRDETLSHYDTRALQALTSMARYVAEFLTAPHAQLGRAGAVCPFAARAADQDLIRLTACSVERDGPSEEALVVEGMSRLRSELAGPGEADQAHRAVVAVFPCLSEPDGASMIERLQRSLKLSFVERGLMIGQFFPSCQEAGLWNRDFRPLQSPVISLAIRNITIFDAPFMLDRQAYIDAFVAAFGDAGAERIAKAARDRGLPGWGACPRETAVAAAAADARP